MATPLFDQIHTGYYPSVQKGLPMSMRTVSFKLPVTLDNQLTRLAKARKLSRSALMREAVESLTKGKRQSVNELAGDLVGCVTGGPRDLATNPKYMAGFGKRPSSSSIRDR
jgi:hypothetical protein